MNDASAGRARGWVAVLSILLGTSLLLGCSSAPPTPVSGPAASVSSKPASWGAGLKTDPAVAGWVSPTGRQPFRRVSTDVGRMMVTSLTGPQSHVRLKVWVWLPPEYDEKAYSHTAFPALMLYPGGTGAGYNTWVSRQYHAREEDATGAARGTLTPFVFVMPSMQLSQTLDTECTDLPGEPRIGTFLAVDVRQMVENNFRVIHDRTGWAAAGPSAGAYCASHLVFNHPDQYVADVSLSGYFSIETALPGTTLPAIRAQNPAAIVVAHPPSVQVLLWSGSLSPSDLTAARAFLQVTRRPTRADLRVLPGGQHLTVDFARMMPGSLSWLSARLAKPITVGS